MTDKDNEIIKALECCAGSLIPCKDCMFRTSPPFPACKSAAATQAICLINRQKAEIEDLENEIDKQYEQAKADIIGNMSDGGTSCHWCIDQHRAEAIKEFAEKLKTEMSFGRYIQADQIDNLVKEMTEETK